MTEIDCDRFKKGLTNAGGSENFDEYIYAGGDTIDADINYFEIKFGKDKPFPEHKDTCLCQQKIKINCYIENKISKNLFIVGSCCIIKFLPQGQRKRTCERCGEPHRKILDNFCSDCRLKNIQDKQEQIKQERFKNWFEDKKEEAIAVIIPYNEKEDAKRKAFQNGYLLNYDFKLEIFNKKTWYYMYKDYINHYENKNNDFIKSYKIDKNIINKYIKKI